MANIQLSLGFSENSRSRPVTSGLVKPDGIEFIFTAATMMDLAWRQFHGHEFDVSELSMSSLIAARSRGDDSFIGLPIFTTRQFWQTNVLVRDDAGINEPKDLIGKRIGVPEYQQTAALWARGILHHEFGVDPKSMHWFMERLPEKSHGGSTGFQPPPGIDFHYIPEATNIGEMLQARELDAALLYITTPNLVDRSTIEFGPDSGVRRLFVDRRSEGARYFNKTGMYPVNHGVVVSKDVMTRYPWAAVNIYKAFVEAKELWSAELQSSIQPFIDAGAVEPTVDAAIGVDLFPYGVKANRAMLETMLDYSYEQGLSARKMSLEDVFYGPSLEL